MFAKRCSEIQRQQIREKMGKLQKIVCYTVQNVSLAAVQRNT